MNPKFYALLTLSLVATVTLPVVNGKLSSLVPAVIAQNTDARKAEADRLNNQGIEKARTGKFRQALQSWYRALQIYREIQNAAGEAGVLNNLGIVYRYLGQYQKARDYHQYCLVIARTIKDRLKEGKCLDNLGLVSFDLAEYRQALDYHLQSLAIFRKIKDREAELGSLINLGDVYLSLNDYSQALSTYQQSLIIAREINNPEGEAKSLDNLGITSFSLAKYEEAKAYHLQSLAILEKINARQAQAASLQNLANVELFLGNYQDSIAHYQQSLTMTRGISYRLGEAKALHGLGQAYSSIGQNQTAISYYQQSLIIKREIGDQQGEANSLGNLGIAHASLGEYYTARDYLQQQLIITRAIGDRYGEGNALGNLGMIDYILGQYTKAIEYQQKYLTIAKTIGDRYGEGNALGNLGLVYLSLEEYPKAIEYQRQALAIAQAIGEPQLTSHSFNNLGIIYRVLNQPTAAIDNLEASLNITLKTRSELSRNDRKQFLATNERTVITLATILIEQNQPEKAFEWLNLATTADLADYNRLIDAKVADPDAQKALDNWNIDNQQLEGMRRQLQDKYSQELAQQIRQFEEKVYKNAETIGDKYPEIAELFETKPTDIAQLQKNIAPDTLVIQPVPLRDKVALFLVTREKLIVIQSDAKRDELNKLVSEYRTQLADRRNADYLVTGSKLYEILIRPIESQIATSSPKNIAIIASGQLRYIPFETLYDKKNDQVLLEKYPIYYLTRISSYQLLKNIDFQLSKNTLPITIILGVVIIAVVGMVIIRNFAILLGSILIIFLGGATLFLIAQFNTQTNSALAFANPQPTKQELKGTETEADNISKIFPGSEKYFGTNATLDIFKKQAFRFPILHLGTHGCFNLAGCPNLGMQANTILFANKEQYNIADAALLGLKNTELITLSACQTAKEANGDGQEISGLAYVLERAGAKSVIASLWDAEDNTSAEIMTQFYQNLKNGMSKSEAMRQAKLSQIKSHPFFWSPFILIGSAN
ncbi:MAG: tetratricopeptide repeat protein [Microcystis aeruginosa Ma_MB_F_20061100_S19]|nr:MAG: tetratricopeptide repeat protein [Microcystis aeruginosa Ma_MB_F_20061100_S19D]TRU17857.1 MAG: tetratricopeptide repeat protein [Microcystis aeruginosa Ma_MB_F_20061100_S19]